MALTGSGPALRVAAIARLPGVARLRAWLNDGSDGMLAQRLAGTAFLIRVASAAIAYVVQILLARWLGTFEFGIYVYVWTWVLLIGSVADLGLGSAAQRFIPEYTERRALDLLRGFISCSRWMAIGIATVIAGLGALGVWVLKPWLDSFVVIPLYLACVTLPLYALTHIQDGIARSYNWINLALLPQFILRQMAILAFMAAAHAAGAPMDAVTAMWVSIAAVWLTTVGQALVLNRRIKATVAAGAYAYDVRGWLTVSAPIFLVEGFYLLLYYVDVLVLQQFSTPDEVAVYYAAGKTLSLVAFIYFSVAATTAHRFSEYYVAGDRNKLSSFIAHAVNLTFWPSLALTVLVLAFGKFLLGLFGHEFVVGYPLMFILAIGLMARASVGPVERLLNMLGQQSICAKVYALAFTLNLALCIVLIPRLGPEGAAAATSTALVVESILLFLVTKRRLGFHVFVWGRAAQP